MKRLLALALALITISTASAQMLTMGVSQRGPVLRGLFANFDATSGVATTSSNVTSWTDSLNSYVISEAVHWPTLTASAQNGKPGVLFNGLNQGLSQVTGGNGLLTATNGVSGITVTCAEKMVTYSNTGNMRYAFIASGTGISSGRFAPGVQQGTTPLGRGGSIRRLDADGVTGQVSSSTFANNLPEIVTTVMDYAAGKETIYRNGVQVLAPTSNGTAGTVSATDSLGFSLGTGLSTNTPTYTLNANVEIYRCAFHNVALSAPEALQEQTEFNNEWAIY